MKPGRSWIFGDDVDTDQLAPGAFMKSSLEELASHCLERLNPDFAKQVQSGEILVGGRNFGAGSSREQAVQSLLQLGVTTVIARSFAGIFQRNAFNLGLLVLECEERDQIREGDLILPDPKKGWFQTRPRVSNFPVKRSRISCCRCSKTEGWSLILKKN